MPHADAQRCIEHRILTQHRLIAERLAADPDKVLAHARANLRRWARKYENEDEPAWMRDWEVLLAGAVEGVVAVLVGGDQEAIRLRSCSPFAGVLSARQRWAVIRACEHEAC